MMMAMARAAKITAKGLARPRRRLSSPGRANMPAPKMPLMTRAVIVQRPIDRTKVIVRPTGAADFTTRSKIDKGLLVIGVGIVIAHNPLHGPGRALVSASGSCLG